MKQPNYYAIIPATVRYDKSLKPNEKLLYGEITALANKNGYCWAENSYFAGLYGVHKKTVSDWVNNLEKQGYINIRLEYIKGTKQVAKRYLYINDTPIHKKKDRYQPNDGEGIHENTTPPIHKKTEEELNNTSINNTSINIGDLSPAKAEPNIPYSEIVEYLNQETNSKFRHTTKSTQKLIKARINEGFALDDFKQVIDTKTYQWLRDKEMAKFLRPETLFGTKFESYLNEPKPIKLMNENGNPYDDEQPEDVEMPF